MTTKKKGKEANAWTKFRLLMWKNFLQQWRHPIQTTVELFLPVLTLSLVLLLRSEIEPSVRSVTKYPPLAAHTLSQSQFVLAGMNITPITVAYSPESELLEDVVRTAVARLVLLNLRDLFPILLPNQLEEIPVENSNIILDIMKRLISVRAYQNSTQLRGIYYDEDVTRIVLAAVEFSDSLHSTAELPTNVSYALRFPERPRLNSFYRQGGQTWRTELVFPVFDLPGPRFPFSWEGGNDPGYVNEMFIAMQQVVSTELITRLTGQSFSNFNFHIQRYPHPQYLEDLAIEALQLLFPMFIMLSFSYTAVNIVRAITVEKEMQLKETMKIMGLPTWLHWTAWFWKQFIYLLIASVFILVILKVNWFTTADGFGDYAIFTNTPWSVLLFFMTLYLICTIFFCFMLSSFFSKASTAALFAGVLWFISYIPAFLLAMDVSMSTAVQIVTCLSINSAMSYGFQLMIAQESTGGMQWGDFWSSPTTETSRFLFGHVVIMLVVDCVLYMLVALYMEQVLPGPFGTPKPWYFFIQPQFWFPKRLNQGPILEEDMMSQSNPTVMKEKDPTDLDVGVKISNLTKVYGSNIAVNDLSLNIYDDQITVLLGHNGAGKSTTISMLTGNLEITRGSVNVAGYDIMKQTRLARGHIGLCPQHNVLFNELTVREHLAFFARLKGFEGIELDEEIDALISKLELDEKRDYQSHGLSGGQKRRLAVGIALSGAARVVLLDEPTSGMDPASRRALWDLLQKEKKGRSMILTTHFMDEADILGDRVAIMANGRLQCVGSPYFLKRHYGVGYTLVVVKKKGFQLETCTELIKRHIPSTTIKEDRGTEVTYSLGIEHSHVFEAMLSELEANLDEIKFTNYGLVATTLEDVFMSVGADLVTTDLDESATTSDSSCGDTLTYDFDSSLDKLDVSGKGGVTGIHLVWQHMTAMWMKLFLVWTRSWPLIILQVVGVLLQINATLGVLEYVMSLTENIQRRELTLREGFSNTETLLNFNGTLNSSIGRLAKNAYESTFLSASLPTMDVTVVQSKPLDDYYLERTYYPLDMGRLRHRILIGATFSDNAVVAWFSNFGYHDVANSLAAVHDAILKAFRPEASLTVYNHPIEANYANQGNMQVMVQMLSMQLASGVGTSLGLASAVFIMFYIKERVSRAKLLQKAAGIQPAVMWGSAAIFDWAWFCLLCVLIIISCVAFNVVGLNTAGQLGRLYLCLMVCAAAMLPINYVCSYFFKGPAVGFSTMFFLNVLLGMMGAQIVDVLSSPFLRTAHVANILDHIFQFFPLYSLVTVVKILAHNGLVEWSCLEVCDYLTAVMPGIQECNMAEMCEHFSEQCCVEGQSWWQWEPPGLMRYVTCMLVTMVFMWAVLMIAEYRLLQKVRVFYRHKKPLPIDESTLDTDVRDEALHAQRSGKGDGNLSLVANRLTKYYGKKLAVDQISFTVGETECFGLLGVNGAGKTSTFKMLMGDESISSGDAFVSGHSVKTNITRVHEHIGYCPQFDAVFPELSGLETLRLFARLRGLRADHAAAQAHALAHALGFTKHLLKPVSAYSGGNRRKLSTAVSLLGRTRLVFVDEPTTGVDPAAKRQVWTSLREARRAGRGVVLTSHSMEECEALCSRLTIMVNGRFQCLGTPQHLKNKFSQGFTLVIKIKVDDATNTVSQEACDAVKNYVNHNFREPRIMEEYQGLLTYYLADKSMPWSRMFGIMERAKQELDVEAYSISQTTLEQIFLQFTKYQREELSSSTNPQGAPLGPISRFRAHLF